MKTAGAWKLRSLNPFPIMSVHVSPYFRENIMAGKQFSGLPSWQEVAAASPKIREVEVSQVFPVFRGLVSLRTPLWPGPRTREKNLQIRRGLRTQLPVPGSCLSYTNPVFNSIPLFPTLSATKSTLQATREKGGKGLAGLGKRLPGQVQGA